MSKKKKPNPKCPPAAWPKGSTLAPVRKPTVSADKGGELVRGIVMSACYILNRDNGFGKIKLDRFTDALYEFWLNEQKGNDTVIDELIAWCEKRGLKL